MGINIRLVEGTPLAIGDTRLTPLVRAVSWNRRQAVVRQDNISGFGYAVVWLQPVAILEETVEGQRRIPIPDHTCRAMLALLAIALIVPLILSLLIRLARGQR